MKKIKLGVNIDHIATLRQARKENFPDPIELAKQAILGGADGIVCHLREDRRHIQDQDVIRLKKVEFRLDLEMAATKEMLQIAKKIKPQMVTLVPEKRQEVTTEGGLDVIKYFKNIKNISKILEENNIKVSLFIDPDLKQIEKAGLTGASFIEIHTGKYANAKTTAKINQELKVVKMAVTRARQLGLRVNAGHGIDYKNVKKIMEIEGIEELNIGFSIIAKACLTGMQNAVKEMCRLMA